ncbi:MAG: class I SAM-dependent methyltransferase [Arthrobacter sp.]
MPDAIFSHPRLARVYDAVEGDRSDLDVYLGLAAEAGAVLDVGCGTGTLACLLAARGVEVLGVDPASASVELARSKPGAETVRWVVGTAPDAAADTANHHRFDLATMTANVAQVFLSDADWIRTLRAILVCLRPGGMLAFETRNPADRAWERWTKECSHHVVDAGPEGLVEDWVEVTRVEGELVTFESPTVFLSDGERVDSTSTLRFRTRDALESTLAEAGFGWVEIRELPYAPTRGWLVLAGA